jgi:hypothetical protein
MPPVTAYKFLATGAIAPVSRVRWPTPVGGSPGAWLEAAAPVEMCRSGMHVCGPDQLSHWLHEELWQVELGGELTAGVDCVIAPRARLLQKVTAWSDEGGAQRFAVAVRDHAAELVATRPQEERTRLLEYVGDSTWHVEKALLESPALAALCAAVAVAKIAAPEEQEAAYRRERAWQSAWIVGAMGLG